MPQPVSARSASQPPGSVGPAVGQDAPASPGFEEMLRVAAGDAPAPVQGRGPGSGPGSVLGRAADPASHDRGREFGLLRDREAPGDERRAEEAPDRASHPLIAAEPVAAVPGQSDAGGAVASQEASWAWPAAQAPLPAQFLAAYVPAAPSAGAPAPTPTPPSPLDGSQVRAAPLPLPAGAAWDGPPAPTSAPHRDDAGMEAAAALPHQNRPAVTLSPLAADSAVVPPNGALAPALPLMHQPARDTAPVPSGSSQAAGSPVASDVPQLVRTGMSGTGIIRDTDRPAPVLPLAHQPAHDAAPVPSGSSQAAGSPVASDVPQLVRTGMSGTGIIRDADRPAPALPFTAVVSNARAPMPTPMLLRPAGVEGNAEAVGAETRNLLVRPIASRLDASPDLKGATPNGIEEETSRPALAQPFASATVLAPPSDTDTAAPRPSASMTPASVQPGAEPGAEPVRLPAPSAPPPFAFAAAPTGVGIERDLGRAAPAPAARAPRTATGDPVQFTARDGAEESLLPASDAPSAGAHVPGIRLTSASPVGADLADAGAGLPRVPGLVERDFATVQGREAPAPADLAAPVSQPEGVPAPAGAPHVQAPHAAALPAAPGAEANSMPSVADQITPAVVSMAQGRAAGGRLSVSITPDELGQVSITVERAADGTTAVHVSAERAATLDLLRRDQADLARALDGAGASPGGHSLSFSLSGGDGRMPGGGGRYEPPVERQPASAAQLYAEAPPPVLAGLAAARLAAARGGLDLTA